MLSTIGADELTDAEFYFKNPSFLYKEWSRIPSAIENIYYIVENCNVDLKTGQYKFPVLPGLVDEKFIFNAMEINTRRTGETL